MNRSEQVGGPEGRVPRLASAPTFSTLEDCKNAIEFLIDRGGFYEGSKANFALALGWTNGRRGAVDEADRRRVEIVCNATRDQHTWPDVEEILGGLVIAYANSQGGMTLIDPVGGDTPLPQLVHIVTGDMLRQTSEKTIHRRRLPTWRTLGVNAANNGDQELARLSWQCEGEINDRGFVSDTTRAEFFKVLRARGLLDS